MASASASAPVSGRTITTNSSIRPSALTCRKSQPSISRSPTRAHVAEVLEDREHALEQRPHRLGALVGLVDDRAAEDDVGGEQRDGGVEIAALERVAHAVGGCGGHWYPQSDT